MESFKKVLLFAGISLFALTACNEEKEDVYTKQSTEEVKANLEEDGIQLLDDMDGLKSLKAVEVLQSFSQLFVGASNNYQRSKTMEYIASLKKSKNIPVLRYSDAEYDMSNMSDSFDNYSGVYTYDKSTGEFTHTSDATQIKFIFPSEGSSSNNSTLTISNFSVLKTSNSDFEGAEFLKSVRMTLIVDAQTLLSVQMNGTYNSDDIPSNLTETIEFKEGYKISGTFVNTEKSVSMDQSFNKGNTNILGLHFDTKGDYDYTNLKDIDIKDIDDVNDFLESVNMWVKVKNIKMVGALNYTSFFKAFDAAGYNSNNGPKTKGEYDQVVKMFNDNVKGYFKYDDSNEIIAKLVFYTHEYQYDNADHYALGAKLVFNDGSSVDDSFFNTGFEDFMEAVDDFMADM